VFEPRSTVRHSHAETISHSFRRGYLDQCVAMKSCGVLYFDSVGSMAVGYPKLFFEQARAILGEKSGTGYRLGLMAWNAARLGAEVAGNFLASRAPRPHHVVYDLAEVMTKKFSGRGNTRGQVLETRFVLGSDNRKVLFMNPDAAAAADLRVPDGSRLIFSAAINPAAKPMRKDAVLFAVAIDNEPVWWSRVGPGEPGQEPRWTEGEVDLAPWAGNKARIILITQAENTDFAWAGWGEPRIVKDELSASNRAMNRVLDAVEKKVRGEPLRHP